MKRITNVAWWILIVVGLVCNGLSAFWIIEKAVAAPPHADPTFIFFVPSEIPIFESDEHIQFESCGASWGSSGPFPRIISIHPCAPGLPPNLVFIAPVTVNIQYSEVAAIFEACGMKWSTSGPFPREISIEDCTDKGVFKDGFESENM